MSVSSRKEIRDSVLNTARQTNTQIGSLVNDFINLTLNEINDPGWAYPRKNFTHNWSWLRRKTTFSTVASTEDYVLPRDVDKIQVVRQTASPIKLRAIDDDTFYLGRPDPSTTEGNPRWYRLWENEGVSTQLSTADTVDVVSSSASDAGSAELSVTVWGTDANGSVVSENYQLNGTTKVSGTITFAAGPLFVSKQKDTTGDITVTEASGSTTLVVVGREERVPQFQVMSLFPIPSSVITIYLEYYTRIRELKNDSDVPQFANKWHWVVRLGTLAKVFQYLNKETDLAMTQNMYAAGVRSMVSADRTTPDLIKHLSSLHSIYPLIHLRRSEDVIV